MTDIVRDPYGNPLKRDATIDALRAEVERLRVENIQMQAALGYAILAEDERHILPSNPFKCGICDANKHLRAENERLRAALADPAKVHINMLAGVIAKPSLAQIIHIYGEDALRAALEEKS